MNIHQFELGFFQSNCYVFWDHSDGQAWIIDPGGDPGSVIRFLDDRDLNPRDILLTHAHLDHVMGIPELRSRFPETRIVLAEADLPLYQSVTEQGAMFNLTVKPLPEPTILLQETDHMISDTNGLKVIPTPGHSPGGLCFQLEREPDRPGLLFSGDTLFQGSIGRTDLWGGNLEILLTSIHERLLTLADDTIVCPGHGGRTTIEIERKNNPYLQ